MSWFGFGGGDKGKDQGSGGDPTSSFDNFSSSGGGFEDASSSFDNTGLGAGGGMSVGGGSLEEIVMAEQQKALVQQVIGRLTEMAFENCIAKPSSSLSSSEQSCIQATVSKYLDASEFVLGRFQRSAQRGQR